MNALYALPEAESGGGLPQPADFVVISVLDELVVDDQKRVRRDVFRKRWDLVQTWHGSGRRSRCEAVYTDVGVVSCPDSTRWASLI